jgi:hypothetical protein
MGWSIDSPGRGQRCYNITSAVSAADRGVFGDMKWVRSNIRDGAWLALIALALQVALSFGHVHGFVPRTTSFVTLAQTSGDSAGPAHQVQLRADQAPVDRDDGQQQPADACVICAVMAMAQAMLLSPAPVLDLPQAVTFRPVPAEVSLAVLAAAEAAFQARAPPAC